MTNAGPGDNIDNNETVEDAAGRFLAAGLSLGVMWWADTPDEFLDELTDTGAVRNSDVLLVAAHSDTEERAGRYLSPDRGKWPEWLKAATPGAQKTVMHWSRNHKLATKRGAGIGEFKAWDHNETFGAAPQRQWSYRAALALHDAKLSGPLLPLLRLVTLEDVGQWPTVLRYLTAKGHRSAPCATAMRKVLYPYARVVDVDAEADVRVSVYRAEVHAAQKVLERWLRTASWRFMKAHGWAPRTHDRSQFIPNVRRAKLTRPRFEGGIDWRTMPAGHKKFRRKDQQINKGRMGAGSPAPCREWRGQLALAYRAKHPALPRLTWRSFDDVTIAQASQAYDYWGRNDQREQEGALAERLLFERDAEDRIAEELAERDAEIPRQAV